VNRLYYGDNLNVLREHIKDDSTDLIYLDPPFNSQASYNVLYKEPSGEQSKAQVEAFVDTWHWNEKAEAAFDEVIQSGNTDAAELLRTMRAFLRENDMMAYLSMMAVRLLELHRVLKPTGSLYLHCDPTASHYLKILLDAIFGKRQFLNEIIWLRTNAHNMPSKGYPKQNDYLLFYSKTKEFTFNPQYLPYGEAQLGRYHRDDAGRLYKAENLTFSTPNPARQFEWRGSTAKPSFLGRRFGNPRTVVFRRPYSAKERRNPPARRLKNLSRRHQRQGLRDKLDRHSQSWQHQRRTSRLSHAKATRIARADYSDIKQRG